ncbi:MAG TPA: hypothetical protein VGE07_27115 [Herpetosiphonaceae bacterium]
MPAFLRRIILFALLAAIAAPAASAGSAAMPAPEDRFWDDQFVPPGVTAANGQPGSIYAMAFGPGGDLYVGGEFASAGGVAAKNIARWDGRIWHAVGGGTDGPVYVLAARGDGLYVGGQFVTAGTVRSFNLARWNGSAWSRVGDDLFGAEPAAVRALAFFNGDVIAGGRFTRAGALTVGHIARWDGNAWGAMGGGVAGEQRAVVSDLQVLDNRLYAGGQFVAAGGAAARNFARWDGSAWAAAGDIGLPSSQVIQLAAGNGGIYATGTFTTAGSLAARGVARWQNGAWSALGDGLATAEAIIVREGRVIVSVSGASGPPSQRLMAWNGSAWEHYGVLLESFGRIYALAQTSGDLYAGGRFDYTQIGPQPILLNSVMRLRDGAWDPLGNGHYAGCAALGCVLAATDQHVYGALRSGPIERWDGMRWSAITPFLTGADNPALLGVGGDLYLGGSFSFVAGSPNLARWDGAAWQGIGGGVNGPVWAIAVDGPRVYVAGSFTAAGGTPANGLARWDGAAWQALGSGVRKGTNPGRVNTMAFARGRLFIGGDFTSVDGVAASSIAQWDGTGWSALTSQPIQQFIKLATDGELLYGLVGDFLQAGGAIGRWDGTSWTGVGQANEIATIAMQGDELIATGTFVTIAGVPANNIARWNGTAWQALGSGLGVAPNSPAARGTALAVLGHSIYVRGAFATAGGRPSLNLARWNDVRAPIFIPSVLK